MDSITAIPQKQIFGLTSKQFFVTLSILFTTAAVSNVARIYFMRLAAERLIMNLRVKLHKSLIYQDIRFFDENRVGELISRLSMDTALVGKTLTINVADGLR
jgi:ABC-type multidrug transport system fused ATPase/permease subunit